MNILNNMFNADIDWNNVSTASMRAICVGLIGLGFFLVKREFRNHDKMQELLRREELQAVKRQSNSK